MIQLANNNYPCRLEHTLSYCSTRMCLEITLSLMCYTSAVTWIKKRVIVIDRHESLLAILPAAEAPTDYLRCHFYNACPFRLMSYVHLE